LHVKVASVLLFDQKLFDPFFHSRKAALGSLDLVTSNQKQLASEARRKGEHPKQVKFSKLLNSLHWECPRGQYITR